MKMEISLASIAFLVLFVTILICVWEVFNWVWLRPKMLEKCLRQQGLSGNPYRLFYGDTKDLAKMNTEAQSKPIDFFDNIVPRVIPLVNHFVQNYGPNSFIWFGPTPSVNITDPALIKEIFTKYNIFVKPHTKPIFERLITGLIHQDGDKWANHRKILNPAFHMEKIKNMIPEFGLSCGEIMSKWEMLVSTKGSCELDVRPDLDQLSSDVISRVAFTSNYEEGKKIFLLIREQSYLTVEALKSVYIPGWRFVPTKLNRRLKHIDNEVKTLLKGVINQREKAMKSGKASHDDLLRKLIDSNLKEIQENGNNKGIGMSTKEVIDECKAFYFAGQETTSVLLTWTMILLSKHQDWQARAREEVLQVFGTCIPNFDGLNRLKIVIAILYEILRLFPPAVMVTRMTQKKKTKVGEMYLPPGVQVLLPFIVIHHDHNIWGDDVKEFKPERFFEGVFKATKMPGSFIPFGWGPRTCIGKNFAMMEGKLVLAMILQRFSFELSPSYMHGPFNLLTLQPQYGAHILLHKI